VGDWLKSRDPTHASAISGRFLPLTLFMKCSQMAFGLESGQAGAVFVPRSLLFVHRESYRARRRIAARFASAAARLAPVNIR
jgi:hypothetical protein